MIRRRALPLRCASTAVVVAFALAACGPAANEDRTGLTLGDCPPQLAAQLVRYAPGLAPKVDLGCGQLVVPLDYAHPEGEQITLQVIRARHQQQPARIGSLIFNPGGPGDPGVEYAPYLLSWLPESLLKRFDVVTLDPRGTGGSAPINCPAPPEAKTPNVLTEAGFARAVQLDRQRSQRCLEVLSSRAPHFNTQAAARDIDRLRAAVGDQTLTFLGLSYGAKLGAEYARRSPTSVRAAVLDGPGTPSATAFEGIVRQTKGFEETFDLYAKGCLTRLTCQLGDPHTFAKRLVAKADLAPIPSGRGADARRADGLEVLDAVRTAMYDKQRWSDLDKVLYDASKLNSSAGLFAMREPLHGPPIEDSAPADFIDAYYVTNCNDSAVGPTDEQLRAASHAMARDYPIFGAHDAFTLFECKTWQPQRAVLEPPVAPTPNRLLVVGTIHDSATPYAGAVALTKTLGNATLLTWDGENHTATAYSTCIADAVARYLIDLTVPPDETHCPP